MSIDHKTVLCCVVMVKEPYIDKWGDYHLRLSMCRIMVYNSMRGEQPEIVGSVYRE